MMPESSAASPWPRRGRAPAASPRPQHGEARLATPPCPVAVRESSAGCGASRPHPVRGVGEIRRLAQAAAWGSSTFRRAPPAATAPSEAWARSAASLQAPCERTPWAASSATRELRGPLRHLGYGASNQGCSSDVLKCR